MSDPTREDHSEGNPPEELMRRAIAAARSGPLGDPNPRVGTVITDAAGAVVGVGHHRGAGTPHAEVDALAQAGEAARGGTAYVTLEPCNHAGRTGPCTQALIDAGVARVMYGQDDPNPEAAGGADALQAAGVAVEGGFLLAECMALNPAWTVAMALGRPFVTWKYAASLDGRSAAADGTSQWLTGPEARADVHRMRGDCGAIMVGTGTALADDPRLTVRDADGGLRDRQPLRVVVGRRDLPERAHLLDDKAPTLQLRTHDPREVLAALHARGVRHVFLEGGPTLAAAFLREELIDLAVAYVAPALLGAGAPAIGDLGIETLDRAVRHQLLDARSLGADVRIMLRPMRSHESDADSGP